MPKRVDKEPKKDIEVNHLKIYVEKGATVSLGDHNFAKILIGVELPYNPTDKVLQEANATIKKAIMIVDGQLDTELKLLGIDID